jgi:DNA-binding LacI/PurR family transcriptional regulator
MPADPSRRRPTIADVARRAGVSPAAVSFAVNGRPGVSDATRGRILAAARELGWRPSASARALTESRTRAVGWVLVRSAETLEADASFVPFLAGMEAALTAAGYALLLQIAPDDAAGLAALERLTAARRVDGLVLTDVRASDPRLRMPRDPRVPVVVAGDRGPPGAAPELRVGEAEGIAAAVAHLVDLGHERIAFAGDSDARSLAREAAWSEAAGARAAAAVRDLAAIWLGEASPAIDSPGSATDSRRSATDPRRSPTDSRPSPATGSPGLPQIGALSPPAATAVVCASDALALRVLSLAPAGVSVVGFGDSPLAAAAGLTSVRVDYRAFGEAAAKLVLARIAGEPAPHLTPAEPDLVVRGSTGRPGGIFPRPWQSES